MNGELSKVLAQVYRYADAGFVVVPMNLDGSKSPSISWKPYQSKRPLCKELYEWFSKPRGIGILCGAISGGMEVIDFDQPEFFEPFMAMLPLSLAQRLTVNKTPGGYHVTYRCTQVCENTKLAMWEKDASCKRRTRIETRGEGGLIVVPGSPLKVHPTGRPYQHHSGPSLLEIQTISPDERITIWQAAMSFDCGVDHEAEAIERGKKRAKQDYYRSKSVCSDSDEPPWDWFDRNGNIEAILEGEGWSFVGESKWRRPGKSHGHSGIVGRTSDGIPCFTSFSTSVDLKGSLGPFNLLCELKFKGNRQEACRFVRSLMKERMRA